VLLAWVLIHSAPFLSLAFSRLNRILAFSSVGALMLYFWMCFANYKAPFIPAAPVFFLVSAVTLVAYDPRRIGRSFIMWALSWALSLAWCMGYAHGAGTRFAYCISIALNAGLLWAFFAASRYFGARMSDDIQKLGPRKSFDQQRIHASKLQTLGELTASLAHEIANPLLAIKGFNHQVREELKEPEVSLELVRTASERIEDNLKRITAIAKLLRSFARDTSRDQLGPVSVREVFDDTVMLMQHQVKSAGVSFRVAAPSEDALVAGNSIELSQLLVNLLANARDAVQDASVKSVSMGYALRESQVRIWVEDSGPGISGEVAENLFRPFYTTKSPGQGTGLGLYIAKLIADRHRAQLQFSSIKNEQGKVSGARFEIELELWNAGRMSQGEVA
jgi:signal transduction histidine kinase